MNERVFPVEIVRPESSWLRALIVGWGSFALRSWIGMLALGALFPHAGIAYWQAVLGLVVVDTANRVDYISWTRARRRK